MSNKLRTCLVTKAGESFICYFHFLEQYSVPVSANMIEETPAGIHSMVYAIVEFPNGRLFRAPIEQVKFVDDISNDLYMLNHSNQGMKLRNKN